nr:putative ribonuclease H-like domain-containing protein [Tanacetum cinerariifolium]
LFSPPKIDLSNSGLKEFQQLELDNYGAKTSKCVSENISNEAKESPDAPLVKELVSDDKLEKKTVFPIAAKKEFVRPKQQEKPVMKLVKFSRHMTGNMSYLSDFKEFNGGYVTFRGGAKGGRITGKGTLKIADESQVLLKVPKKNNMYSVDMKNIVPKESLTCLVAKATLDESMLWHRRLGHINFKTINKLVKENLVRGLPPKHFENYRTCIACLKGKQHKASSTKNETTCILKKFITEIENLVDKKVKAEAVNTACYVQNKVLVVKPHNKTPYELFRGRTPALRFMRPFGYHVTILNTLDHLGKFDGKSDDGFFVGYSLNSKAFRVYNTRTRKVEESLHVRFLEDKPIITGDGPKWLFDIDVLTKSMNYVPVVADGSLFDSSSKNASNDEPQPSSDAGKKNDDGVSKESGINDKDVNTVGPSINTVSTNVNTGSLNINTVSPSVTTASLEATHADIFDDETEVDMSNISTTYLVSSILNTRIHKDHSLDHVIGDVQSGVQTRRMTKTKNKQGFISAVYEEKAHEDLHTCLFTCFLSQEEPKKGYTREEGIDYDKVFAPVARIEAIRLFLAYALFKDFIVYQMDVKSSYLYGKIEEEVYVCQPQGFEDPEFSNRVYKVEKALYGQHQAPRDWYETLSTYLLDNGFHRGQIDKTLFIKRFKGDILLVQVYVDDIIFRSTRKEMCTEFEKMMHKKFQMSSMGELIFFLGLQVTQKDNGIFISQYKYVDEIMKKFGFSTVKIASTPIETSKPLLKDAEAKDVDVHLYRSMIGSLMYLTSSRPDIMFVVYACARFQVTPKVSHLHAVKRIFRYLKGQPKLGLWYPKDSTFDLEAYTDSDYTGASLDRKSTTGDFNIYLQVLECLTSKVLIKGRIELKVNVARYNLQLQKHKSKKSKKRITELQSRVLALETTKANRALEIESLKRRVKKLEKRANKRTHKLKRLYKIGFSKRIKSSDEASLSDQEDVSKQGRMIDDLDVYKELHCTTAGVEVSTAAITSQISMDEITLAKALIDIKTSKPKAKGIVMQEPSETPTPTPIDSSQQPSKAKDKGKAKMIKPEKPLKRKDQIMIDEEVVKNLEAQLQAKLEEEERIARQKEEEANIALIAEWDNTQAWMLIIKWLNNYKQKNKSKETTRKQSDYLEAILFTWSTFCEVSKSAYLYAGREKVNIKFKGGLLRLKDFMMILELLLLRDVKEALECMKISGFMHGITNPELIKRLHNNIPKLVDDMMRVTTEFLRGKTRKRQQKGGNLRIGQATGNTNGAAMAEDSQTKDHLNFLSKDSDRIPAPRGGGWDGRSYDYQSRDGGTLCDEEHSTSAWMNFMVMRSPSPYNGIIGRLRVRRIQAVPSVAHEMLKFLVTEEKIQVAIHPEYREQTIAIGSTLTERGRKELCSMLRRNFDIFAWKPADMTRVPWNIAEHRLNIRKGCLPVRQKKRGQAPERNREIHEEVEKLVNVGIMKEVHYHSWLSNPVMVKKHDDSWRMCVDFKDLNKACPKDGYPLLEIDSKVESLCGYPFKCLLDAYKGYHQIKMEKEDEEKTTFITSQ